MKITPSILSIPPYISTSWNNITAIYLQKKGTKSILTIALQDGITVELPKLEEKDIDSIFEAHSKFFENGEATQPDLFENTLSFSLPMKTETPFVDLIGSQLRHNPEQSHLPKVPPHILEKIQTMMKSLGVETGALLEPAEEGCNCISCQLYRSSQDEEEELVTDEDLSFRDWEVTEVKDNLYHVVNPLDSNEYYDVYLGTPIGCTCGHKSCEHIKAVLNT